jgi:mRNA-degrading endonuclease RelE of RelBE toxin-antitoxin system
MYKVVFRTRFERVFKKLDRQIQVVLLEAIGRLAEDPFSNKQVRAIVGVKQMAYRLRVGRWRILYIVLTRDQKLEVIDLFLRKGGGDYRDL